MADKDSDLEAFHALLVLEGEGHSNGYRDAIIAEHSDPPGSLLDIETTDDPLPL